MKLSALHVAPARLVAPLPGQRGAVDASGLITGCRLAFEQGASLVALWGSDERDRGRGFTVRVALLDGDGITVLEHEMADGWTCPDLTPFFPAAGRLQRAAYDLLGIQWDGADQRPWLRHTAWPADVFPLRQDAAVVACAEPAPEDYPFVRVEGEGVHEVPVGPVHAGIIEPGHFRFQAVGEKVLRLEERFGYAHKGIEQRFRGMPVADAYRLAGRVSGDSTVAYAWAYAQALEGLARFTPPPRGLALRALCLERERLANHLGDLGALGNDAGFAFGLAQFSRLREDVLRVNAAACGHRLLMDAVIPGGMERDLADDDAAHMRAQGAALGAHVARLRELYGEHAGLQDRFRTAGIVTPRTATALGLAGLAGRASGVDRDLRRDFPTAPYDALAVQPALRHDGDVAARVAVRFDEVQESLRLCAVLLDALPAGPVHAACPLPRPNALAIGYLEGWRGPVFVALEAAEDATVRRCHPHDVSWQNWPAVEHAILGNIVPDFPLINKSFNLSYSGADL